MKNTMLAMFTLLALMFLGCSAEKEKALIKNNNHEFRTTSVTRTQTGEREVVCHNCRAQFKLSQQMLKMSMKGDAIIPCPVCKHNYLHKEKVSNSK